MTDFASRTDIAHYAPSRGLFAAMRLAPGSDLIAGLRQAQREFGAQAMAVVACVGSLDRVQLRHADQTGPTPYRGRYEITSLSGTIDPQHQHLHLSMADGEGRCYGGHLLPGTTIYTTAEITLLLLTDIRFIREPCPQSGFDELAIYKRMPMGDFTV